MNVIHLGSGGGGTRDMRKPVSMRALIARINRKLKPEFKALKATRGARAKLDFGDYYVVEYNHNFIDAAHVDPEGWGRDLGFWRATSSFWMTIDV